MMSSVYTTTKCRRRLSEICARRIQQTISINSCDAIRRGAMGRWEARQARLQMEWWEVPEEKCQKSRCDDRYRKGPWGRRTLYRLWLRALGSVSPVEISGAATDWINFQRHPPGRAW